MGISENSKYSNCDKRGWDEDAWYTLFECPAFNEMLEEGLYSIRTADEELLTPDSLVLMIASFEAAILGEQMEAKWE